MLSDDLGSGPASIDTVNDSCPQLLMPPNDVPGETFDTLRQIVGQSAVRVSPQFGPVEISQFLLAQERRKIGSEQAQRRPGVSNSGNSISLVVLLGS